MAKQKGINARAWFYSQSFHSSVYGRPECSECGERFGHKEGCSRVSYTPATAPKTQDEQDFGGAFDGNRVTSDADGGL